MSTLYQYSQEILVLSRFFISAIHDDLSICIYFISPIIYSRSPISTMLKQVL